MTDTKFNRLTTKLIEKGFQFDWIDEIGNYLSTSDFSIVVETESSILVFDPDELKLIHFVDGGLCLDIETISFPKSDNKQSLLESIEIHKYFWNVR